MSPDAPSCLMPHTEVMFHSYQLSTILVADHQVRLRNAASRRRIVRRNKAPAGDLPSARVSPVAWRDGADSVVNEQRVHCIA